MDENFGTAIIQAVGFLGVFAFFVYRLLSEKVSLNTPNGNTKNKSSKSFKAVNTEKKGLFGRKKKVDQTLEIKKKEIKKGWFNR